MPAVAEPVKPAPAPAAPAIPAPSAKPISEPPTAPATQPAPDDDPFAAQDAEIMSKFKEFDDKTTPKPKVEPKPDVKPPDVKPQPKPEDKTRPVFTEPKELRAELARLKRELTTRNDSYSKMESTLKELETKG